MSEIIHAYRHLLRAGLRAVQFSMPARFVVRDQLREGFRERDATFNRERIRRTIWFLKAAAQERGLEHKILKNLVRVYWERKKNVDPWRIQLKNQESKKKAKLDLRKVAEFEHYDRTIAMLNDTMGLCLRGIRSTAIRLDQHGVGAR